MVNKGLDQFGYRNTKEDIEFYYKMIKEDKEGGVIIKRTTIKCCDVNLQVLSRISSETGEVIILEPRLLKQVFDDLLNNDIFVINTNITVFIQSAFYITYFHDKQSIKK